MDPKRYKVTLERAGKTIIVILRGDDYAASVRIDRGCNAKMKYGSGAMWYVKDVKEAE